MQIFTEKKKRTTFFPSTCNEEVQKCEALKENLILDEKAMMRDCLQFRYMCIWKVNDNCVFLWKGKSYHSATYRL